jgi:hypothetical protein
MGSGHSSSAGAAPSLKKEPGRRPAQIDLERLADKVYRLLLAEIRLGQARGERPPHTR